jgi:hypothetical protein
MILIFGSSIKKQSLDPHSDIDILITFNDNADTYTISKMVDQCLSSMGVLYDYGWYKITQLNEIIESGIDFYPLYDIFNNCELICGDKRLLEKIRYKLSSLDPIKMTYNTLITGLEEYSTLKQAIIRRLRVLFISTLLIDFIKMKKYIPSYEQIMNWAFSPESPLNNDEKRVLHRLMRIIKYREDVPIMVLKDIEEIVFNKVFNKIKNYKK